MGQQQLHKEESRLKERVSYREGVRRGQRVDKAKQSKV